MNGSELVQFLIAYVLVFFRIAGMMVLAPLLGSGRVPRRVRLLLACAIALGMAPAVPPPALMPDNMWDLAVGIGGELFFGIAMGMILSFVFIAVQWAGEMIGQQMGLNLSETFDPQFGAQGSLIGDMYFLLALVVFMLVRGHHALLKGVHESFAALPLLSLTASRPLLDTTVGLLEAATRLAIQLAAPMLVTMLVIDVALGFIGKTVPQINVMSVGIMSRSLAGMLVLIVGIMLSSDVMTGALLDSMDAVVRAWRNAGITSEVSHG